MASNAGNAAPAADAAPTPRGWVQQLQERAKAEREARARDLAAYNYWRNYRDSTLAPLTPMQFFALDRNRHYITNRDPGEPAPPFSGYEPRGSRSSAPPYTVPANRGFENFIKQQLPVLDSHWKGTRILGKGGFGVVGLWEYVGDNPPAVTKVAVKELNSGVNADLTAEGNFMMRLNTTNSEHIVRLERDPVPEEGWDGRVRRLVMEYCPMGSLEGLLHRRWRRGYPFLETTLWRIFECLVDGLSVLQEGAEISIDPVTGVATPSPVPNWNVLVHFDMKPDNVLLGEKNERHAFTPVCKISDFGLARERDPVNGFSDRQKQQARRRGTRGYYMPEQFTDRFDYRDWERSDVAGQYCSASNVWGMGIIMYCLIRLVDDELPSSNSPFYPNFLIDGKPAKGLTYGVELMNTPYSEELRHTILECMYEKPANRPPLSILKEKVHKNLTICRDALIASGDSEGEEWDSFVPPEPIEIIDLLSSTSNSDGTLPTVDLWSYQGQTVTLPRTNTPVNQMGNRPITPPYTPGGPAGRGRLPIRPAPAVPPTPGLDPHAPPAPKTSVASQFFSSSDNQGATAI